MIKVAQNKVRTLWCNCEPLLREAVENYIADNNTTISEFVRECVAKRLLVEGYLVQESLEAMLV